MSLAAFLACIAPSVGSRVSGGWYIGDLVLGMRLLWSHDVALQPKDQNG